MTCARDGKLGIPFNIKIRITGVDMISFLLLVLLCQLGSSSPVVCSRNEDCEPLVGKESICRSDGRCSNVYSSGCLYGRLPQWNKLRVCNSDDPPGAAGDGLCRDSSIPYDEIRIYGQNWESSIFGAWLMQIVLSEVLNVPATIETGRPDAQISFYDPSNAYGFGTNDDDLRSLQNAIKYKDCTRARRSPLDYESCAHVVPEVWDFDLPWVREMIRSDDLSPPMPLGILGLESWYVPKFTAEANPALLSYFGLRGDTEQQRRLLAETFLRPTTWYDYCRLISQNNCTIPDGVAQRAPREDERKRMFVENLYTGHFRKTEKNDCATNPTTCTGHIADYPCSWSSYTTAQTYHLKIPLEGDGDEPNGGYSYEELVEIYRAANYTKSNVILQWWQPEVIYNSFQGTDAEFIRVTLPTATQECFDNRITPDDRCSEIVEDRVGSPLGVCEELARPLQKLVVEFLQDGHGDPLSNPAFDVISSFTLSDLQLGEIFKRWQSALTPRQAICEWLIAEEQKNGFLTHLVPPSYPRVSTETELFPRLMLLSLLSGCFVSLLVLFTIMAVYVKRNGNAMKWAQTEFLYILLAGAFFVGIGAVVMSIQPSNVSCVIQEWLVNIGFALEVVPLIVKVAAINRLMNAAERLRRVKLERNSLFVVVFVFNGVVVLFLICWTLIDPPRKVSEYQLSNRATEGGDYVVSTSYYCRSERDVWPAISVGWNVLLLLVAAVLAFQNSRVRQSRFNESQLLAFLIYSCCMFVLVRVVLEFFLTGHVSGAELARYRSLVFSLSTFATIFIYFVPKLFLTNEEEYESRSVFHSVHHLSGNMSQANSLHMGGVRGWNDQLVTPPSSNLFEAEESVVANRVAMEMNRKSSPSKGDVSVPPQPSWSSSSDVESSNPPKSPNGASHFDVSKESMYHTVMNK